MRALFLVTVDCDIRSDHMPTRDQAMHVLLDVFARHGVAGHATWYLNENDFQVTVHHEAFLDEALRRGDTIAVHDHVDFMYSDHGDFPVDRVEQYGRQSKTAVEAWLCEHGRTDPVVYHRNGCLTQRDTIYEALARLEYEVVSDVWPGETRPGHRKFTAFDNRDVPIGIGAYRHDAHNFADHTSTRGRFLHIPVFHMGIGPPGYEELSFEKLDAWIEAATGRAVEPIVLTWLFHPYEIMYRGDGNRVASGIDPDRVERLTGVLCRLADDPRLTFASTAECVKEVHDE